MASAVRRLACGALLLLAAPVGAQHGRAGGWRLSAWRDRIGVAGLALSEDMPVGLFSDAGTGLQAAMRLRAAGDSAALAWLGSGSSMTPSPWRALLPEDGTLVLAAPGARRRLAAVPIHAESLRVVGAGGVFLAATFARPEARGRHPAILLVGGSGPSTRGLLLTYSAILAASGVASLVYDKRGTGASSGEYRGDRLDELADDVRAALAALRARDDVDPSRIGILGQSQGAWLAMMVAAGDTGVAFVMMTSGGAFPIEQETYRRVRAVADAGFDAAAQGTARTYVQSLFRFYASGGRDSAGLAAQWREAQSAPWVARVEGPSRDPTATPMSDAWRRFGEDLGRDWAAIYRRVRVPVYALNSRDDPNVPSAISRETLARSLPRGAAQLTWKELRGDHGFVIRQPDGTMSLDDRYFPTLLAWVHAATAAGRNTGVR